MDAWTANLWKPREGRTPAERWRHRRGSLLLGAAPDCKSCCCTADQDLRPDADVTTGSWTTTPLWEKLDEQPSDEFTTAVTYTKEYTAPGTDSNSFEVGLQNGEDNGVRPTVTFVSRLEITTTPFEGGGFAGRTERMILKEGAITVHERTFPVRATFIWYTDSFTLTQAELDSISDFTNLRAQFVAESETTGTFDSITYVWYVSTIRYLAECP